MGMLSPVIVLLGKSPVRGSWVRRGEELESANSSKGTEVPPKF